MKENTINLTLQGKGGVGKSYITTILAQYFKDYKNIKISGADSDPINRSFSGFKAINALPIDIMENDTIVGSKFDSIFELMLTDNKSTFIIDNGASTFLPMVKYIKDSNILEMFKDENKNVFIHTVIVGGQSQADTLQGLSTLYELVQNLDNVKLVIWLNEFQGKITEADEYFKIVSPKTAGFVLVRDRNSDTFTADIEKLTKNRLTLKEALLSSDFNLIAKSRLKRVFDEIYDQLDEIYDKPQEKNEKTAENSK